MIDLESKITAIGFGTELEYANISRECAARAIQSVIGGEINHEGGVYDKWIVIAPDGRKWAAVFDCSIGATREESAESCAEIVTPVLHLADMDNLQNVVRALRAAGARATERGSQHIHIGARGYLNTRQIANFAKIFYRQESIILRAAGGMNPGRKIGRKMGFDTANFPRIFGRKFRAIGGHLGRHESAGNRPNVFGNAAESNFQER